MRVDTAAASADTATLRVIDLFAGAGGLTEGLHRVGGFDVAQAVESDAAAAATFRANFGDVVYAGKIEDWLAEREVPEVDLVVGGPPCQGFSLLGKRDAADPRNALWRSYAATLVRARPRWFVLENVAAFLKSPQLGLLEDATAPGGLLEDYTFQSQVLNAADFGAPQNRKRAVIIGHHRDVLFPGFPEPTHRGRERTVSDALRGVRQGDLYGALPDRWTSSAAGRLPGSFRTRELHVARFYTSTTKARIRHIPAGGNRFDIPDGLLPPCWRNHTTGSGDVMGRLRWDRPSVTIRTEFFKPEKGRYLHPEQDRVITHFEAALIQGFDRGRFWVGNRTDIARQIGNAVPIPLAEAIGRVIKDARDD